MGPIGPMGLMRPIRLMGRFAPKATAKLIQKKAISKCRHGDLGVWAQKKPLKTSGLDKMEYFFAVKKADMKSRPRADKFNEEGKARG